MRSKYLSIIALLTFIGALTARFYNLTTLYIILMITCAISVIWFQQKNESEHRERANKK